jgi:hypothetical protein
LSSYATKDIYLYTTIKINVFAIGKLIHRFEAAKRRRKKPLFVFFFPRFFLVFSPLLSFCLGFELGLGLGLALLRLYLPFHVASIPITLLLISLSLHTLSLSSSTSHFSSSLFSFAFSCRLALPCLVFFTFFLSFFSY